MASRKPVVFPENIHRVAAEIRRQALANPGKDPVVPGAAPRRGKATATKKRATARRKKTTARATTTRAKRRR